MYEKEIFGTEQPDKRGGHFLYENDGRLINSAQISGNITDERILEALKTAEGFRNSKMIIARVPCRRFYLGGTSDG